MEENEAGKEKKKEEEKGIGKRESKTTHCFEVEAECFVLEVEKSDLEKRNADLEKEVLSGKDVSKGLKKELELVKVRNKS